METDRRRGLGGDIRRLKENGGATAAEFREFMQGIKGKSPQEMLGVVAQSSLLQSTLTATAGCIVLMAAFTAGPYAWGKFFPATLTPTAAQSQKSNSSADAAKNNAAPPAAGAPNQPAAAALAPGEDPANSAAATTRTKKSDDDLLDKLGVGETKSSDPNANPLDSDKDDLLKEIK